MNEQEKEFLLLQRDTNCNSNKIKELTDDFKKREPAKETQSFITEVKIIMKGQTDELRSLTKTLDTHIGDQKAHEAKLQLSLEEYQKAIFCKFDENQKMMTDFITSANSKFAPIMVYKILVWAGGIAGAAMIIGLLGLIYRTIIFVEK